VEPNVAVAGQQAGIAVEYVSEGRAAGQESEPGPVSPAPGARVVPQVIASLKERKLISVEGTKVSYRLG